MKKQNNRQRILANEKGMAAIIITIVLMLVISLIVLGFAQITRREQQQTFDRQLATQAYYAAESGVNLAQEKIKNLIAKNEVVPEKTDCQSTSLGTEPITAAEMEIDGSNIAVTCLLVRSELSSLNYHDVGMESVVTNVESKSGAMSEIILNWQAAGSSANPSGCNMAVGTFPPAIGAGGWTCNQPLLRVDVVPVGAGGFTQADLAARQFTTFFYPQASGSTASYAAGSTTSINRAACVAAGTPYKCTARINNLGASSYAVRVMSIYGSASLNISALDGGTPATLVNGQTVIDSTAKASDILRRIQVSVSNSGSKPDFGLVSGGGLCKRYSISSVVSIDTGGGSVDTAGCLLP